MSVVELPGCNYTGVWGWRLFCKSSHGRQKRPASRSIPRFSFLKGEAPQKLPGRYATGVPCARSALDMHLRTGNSLEFGAAPASANGAS
jgi:hypothetical protein